MRAERQGVNSLKVAATLLTKSEFPKEREIYKLTSQQPETLPLMTEEDILDQLVKVCQERELTSNNLLNTYWDGQPIIPHHVFQACIQFANDHTVSLPETALPPETDVASFINYVIQSDSKVGIGQQFEYLLEITGDNVIAAANIGMMGTRIMARGRETRSYPGIGVSPNKMQEWGGRLRQFEVYNPEGISDGPGDHYYFWTHFFAANYFQLANSRDSKVMQTLFCKGTNIMTFTRKYIARESTMTDHREASEIGRNTGLAVAHNLNNG